MISDIKKNKEKILTSKCETSDMGMQMKVGDMYGKRRLYFCALNKKEWREYLSRALYCVRKLSSYTRSCMETSQTWKLWQILIAESRDEVEASTIHKSWQKIFANSVQRLDHDRETSIDDLTESVLKEVTKLPELNLYSERKNILVHSNVEESQIIRAWIFSRGSKSVSNSLHDWLGYFRAVIRPSHTNCHCRSAAHLKLGANWALSRNSRYRASCKRMNIIITFLRHDNIQLLVTQLMHNVWQYFVYVVAYSP